MLLSKRYLQYQRIAFLHFIVVVGACVTPSLSHADCITSGLNNAWNNRAATLNDPVTKGMVVPASTVGLPAQPLGFLQGSMNVGDIWSVVKKSLSPLMSGMMGGIPGMLSSALGAGGSFGSNPGPGASASGGGDCTTPSGGDNGNDPRSDDAES